MPKRRNSASVAPASTEQPESTPLAASRPRRQTSTARSEPTVSSDQPAESSEPTGVETDDARPSSDDTPTHYVRCEPCQAGLHVRLLAAGFIVVTYCGYEFGTTFGMGENHRPLCPVDGHGEMQLADEQLRPAHEAITEAAEKLNAEEPSQPKLFQTFKPFNIDGALKQIGEKNRSVQSAKTFYDGAKEQASIARKAWEREAEQLQTLIADLDRKKKDRDQQIAQAMEKARLAEEAACGGVEASESEKPPVLSSDLPTFVVEREPQPEAVGASA